MSRRAGYTIRFPDGRTFSSDFVHPDNSKWVRRMERVFDATFDWGPVVQSRTEAADKAKRKGAA